jgi:hypothetical protein
VTIPSNTPGYVQFSRAILLKKMSIIANIQNNDLILQNIVEIIQSVGQAAIQDIDRTV